MKGLKIASKIAEQPNALTKQNRQQNQVEIKRKSIEIDKQLQLMLSADYSKIEHEGSQSMDK